MCEVNCQSVHNNLFFVHEFMVYLFPGAQNMKYLPRWLDTQIQDGLKSHPVIVLTGPRQVGKSILLEQAKFLKDWRYITLDDSDMLEQAKEYPKGLFLRGQADYY